MRKLKKATVVFCCFFLLMVAVTAEGQQRLHYKEKNVTLELLPDSATAGVLSSRWSQTHTEEPAFIAEALYSLPKKEFSGLTQMEMISRLGRSFSTMEGLQYFSNTRNKTQVLYPKSYTVSDPVSRKKCPDQTNGNANGTTGWYFQSDNSFGDSLYQADFIQTDDTFCFMSTNLDSMKFMGFKAVKEQNLQLNLLITEKEDTLSVYILAQAKFLQIPLIDTYIEKSFMARLEAVYSWFKDNYYEN